MRRTDLNLRFVTLPCPLYPTRIAKFTECLTILHIIGFSAEGEDGEEEVHELRFPNPEKPPQIDHGPAEGGFNFGGSLGFIWQAMAVHSAVLKGAKEMDAISHRETVSADLMWPAARTATSGCRLCAAR